MGSNFKRIMYLCGAVVYVCAAILILNKFVKTPIIGIPAWADFVIFVIQVAPLLWLVGRAINVKDDRQKEEVNPLQKSWRHKQKSKIRKN